MSVLWSLRLRSREASLTVFSDKSLFFLYKPYAIQSVPELYPCQSPSYRWQNNLRQQQQLQHIQVGQFRWFCWNRWEIVCFCMKKRSIVRKTEIKKIKLNQSAVFLSGLARGIQRKSPTLGSLSIVARLCITREEFIWIAEGHVTCNWPLLLTHYNYMVANDRQELTLAANY